MKHLLFSLISTAAMCCASARPLMTEGGLVIVSNGMGKLLAINPKGTGDISKTNLVWQATKAMPRKSTPVLVDGKMYSNDEKGIISCVDSVSGKTIWKKRGRWNVCCVANLCRRQALFFLGRRKDSRSDSRRDI